LEDSGPGKMDWKPTWFLNSNCCS